MTGRDEVIQVLSRLLRGGPMEGLPKRRADADILLALAAAGLDPAESYGEPEINEYLSTWLGRFARTAYLDHVSVRRSLIDWGFLQRDPSGAEYSSNPARIDAVLAEDAKSVQPGDILASLRREREARRRAHQG